MLRPSILLFLFFSCITAVHISADSALAVDCSEGEYISRQSGECEPCRECGRYMYIRKVCSLDQNTQCGWCGSKTVVKNEDFQAKCEPWSSDFSMFGELKQRIKEDMERVAEAEYYDDDDIVRDANGALHIIEIEHRNRMDEDREAYKDDDRFVKMNDEEYTSWETEQDISPKEVSESDIGQELTSEELTEAIEEVLPRDRQPSVPKTIVVTAYRVKDDDYADENIYDGSEESYHMDADSNLFSSRVRLLIVIMMSTSIILFMYSLCRLLKTIRQRRSRFDVVPAFRCMTREQSAMIDRCAQKVPKDVVKGYENQLYLVDEI